MVTLSAKRVKGEKKKNLLDILLHNVAAVDSRIKDVPAMCDWIQGQHNANNIKAFYHPGPGS